MRLIILALVALIGFSPLALSAGSRASPLATFAPLVGGLFLVSVGILLTAQRLTILEGKGSQRAEDRLFLAKVVLIGVLLRVLIAVFLRVIGVNSFLAPDEGTFDANGRMFEMWLSGESSYPVSTRFSGSLQVGYFYFVGTLYHLFGIEPLVPIFFNCVFGALAAVPVYRIAEDLGGRAAARRAAVLVTFFPSLVLWSTLLIRDSLVILSILLVVMAVMDLRRGFSPGKLLSLLVYLMALGTLRQYIFVLVAMSALLSLMLGRRGRIGRSLAVGVLALIGLFAIMRIGGFGVWELERTSLHQLNLHRQYNSVVGYSGSFLPQVDISEPVNAITYLPVGMVYFLGSPFPWQVFSPRQVMALPDVIIWYLLLPAIFLGIVHAVRTRFRDAAMLLFCIAAITVLYSLVEGNVGIIFRHRAQVIALMMVYAGLGLTVRRERALKAVRPVPAESAA